MKRFLSAAVIAVAVAIVLTMLRVIHEGVPCLSSFLNSHFPDLLQGGVQIRIHDPL